MPVAVAVGGMTVRRPQQFVSLYLVLSLLGIAGLAVAGSLSIVTVVVGVVIAGLVAAEATAPVHVRPQWRRRLRVVMWAAVVVFALVVGQRALTLWPSSV